MMKVALFVIGGFVLLWGLCALSITIGIRGLLDRSKVRGAQLGQPESLRRRVTMSVAGGLGLAINLLSILVISAWDRLRGKRISS
jgi:hypothetical protein